MFALQIIIILLFISGLIAYIGDYVGRFIGKKRLLLFGLRPRYSAIAITVFTGVVIAIFTGTILFVASADVRTALFGLEKLKNELKQINNDKAFLLKEIETMQEILKKSKDEIAELTKTKEKLQRDVRASRSGTLLFKVNDVITNTIIKSDSDREKVKDKLMQILATTDSGLKGILGGKLKHYVVMPKKELNEAIDYITSRTENIIVRIVAARNVVIGEEIPVHFELFENQLIFRRYEEILTGIVNGTKKTQEIEQDIKELLSHVNDAAKKQGIIPDISGSVGYVSYSRIFEIAKSIKNRNKIINVKIVASKDTYSIGPLEIEIRVEE